jgi:putative aldouronate transport system substrate-binding protein
MTGYKVEYEALPSEERLVKLNAILAARQSYDIMVLAPDSFSSTIQLNAYMALDDLLESHGQAVKAGTRETLWTSTTVNNQIFGVPYRLSVENYNSGLRVRTDLFKQAGVDKLPGTPEELYDALLAVKNELNIIPLTAASGDAFIAEIASAFGLYTGYVVTDAGVTHRGISSGAKDYAEYMNKLLNDGLLDNEWVQNSGEMATEKFLSGRAAVNRVYWWEEPSASETLLANFPDATFEYLPPLRGDYSAGIAVNRSADKITVIPRSAENPQAAMDWMNEKVKTPEAFRLLAIGEEGVHYNVLDNGEYAPINPAFTDDKNFASEYLTSTIADDYDKYWSQTRVRKNESLYGEFMKMQANVETARIYYEPTSFMPPNEDLTLTIPTLNTLVNDTLIQMIAGTRSTDTWDAYVQEYNDAGGAEVETIINEWWLANKAELADRISHD